MWLRRAGKGVRRQGASVDSMDVFLGTRCLLPARLQA